MDLRRVRIQLTILYTVLSALSIGIISLYAAHAGRDRLIRSAERDALQQNTQLLVQYTAGKTDAISPDAWVVDLGEGAVASLSKDTKIEPPLRTIVQRVGSNPDTEIEPIAIDGDNYLAAVRKLAPDNDQDQHYFVTATRIDDYLSEADSLRTRIGLAAVALTALCGGVGYWFAKRSLEPARLAMSQQRDFIADAAHELRTPLAVIRASASHALSKPRENRDYQQSLSEILAATERAGLGVGGLLELARLDAGQATPRRAPLRIDLLVEEVAAAVRVDGVHIEAPAGEAIIVDADYALMQQVVENLTRNAAARASKITLTTARHATWAVVDVGDNGPGFDPAILPHVFDRFRRGDGKGSSGIGMAIAKGIVLAHDGRIEASNHPEGGANVRILLPLSRER